MPRNATGSAGSDSSSDSAAPREPEIMKSSHLANILTLSLVEMIEEATKRYEAAGLGRRMAPELAAMRGTVADVRRWHGLAPIDWETGEPREDDAGATVSPSIVAAIEEAAS